MEPSNDPSQLRDAASPNDSAGSDAGTDAEVPAGRPTATGLVFPVTMDSPGAEPIFDVFRPTDVAEAVTLTGHPLPIIVWANGGCLRTTVSWKPLFERWAAAGFVVLALSVKPGQLVEMFGTTTQVEHGKLIDWALAQAVGQSPPYAGNLDAARIVAAGNSCGGVTALELTAKDDRISAAFVLSGSSAIGSSNAAVVDALQVPVGFVVGNPAEDIAAPNAIPCSSCSFSCASVGPKPRYRLLMISRTRSRYASS